jgi:membrane protease YdiL (CAAX protease family)
LELHETQPDQATLNARYCSFCGSELNAVAQFCSSCGKSVVVPKDEGADPIETLMPVFIYYFVTLVILGVYKLTDIFGRGLSDFLVISVVDIIIVVGFCIYHYKSLVPLFSIRRVKPGIVLLVIMGCIAGAIVVHFIAQGLNSVLGEDDFYLIGGFSDTSHPELFAILFICVQPAIFEEVAFRGFMFNNIMKVSGGEAAIYVTSFMFGIIHLAFLGLIWLVPIGLAFAFLRLKFNTLWYGMIGHFTYNFVIIAIEYTYLNQYP